MVSGPEQGKFTRPVSGVLAYSGHLGWGSREVGGHDCQGLLTWMSGRGLDAGHSCFLLSWCPWLTETTFVRRLLAQKSI